MIKQILLFLLLATLLSPHIIAQDREQARQVLVFLDEEHDIGLLSRLGIDVHEGLYAPGVFFEGVLMQSQMDAVTDAGFQVRVMIEDMAKWYVAHRDDKVEQRAGGSCRPDKYAHWKTPEHFQLGSLGGYKTYEEMLDDISYMHDLFPHFITKIKPIGDFLTQEKRRIYWTKISSPTKNLKSQVLYTALHHAREPGSMLQLLYFMWYVLENYENDPMIKTLLDHVELYFIPCVNPDGYLFNEAGYARGNVYWRKNRRIINSIPYGVDLNRNYGFKWGLDNEGSSDIYMSQIYRGPEPFSEPETQAVAYFCKQHEFKTALNAHTFSALLIYPWGYTYDLTEDSVAFYNLGNSLTKENNYTHGNSKIIYRVNGDSDDWMYGDTSKNKIFSFTPEVGRFGFWAPREVLIPDCKQMLWTNIGAGLSCLPLVHFTAREDRFVRDFEGQLTYNVTNIGFKKGNFKLDITPLSGNIASFNDKQKFYTLSPQQTGEETLKYRLKPGVPDGDSVLFKVDVYNGYYTQSFTVGTRYLGSDPIFEEDFADLHRWEKSAESVWGISTRYYTSSPGALTDSPHEKYDSSVWGTIQTKSGLITVPEGSKGLVWTYNAKWFLPRGGYDIVVPFITVNGERIEDLCPKYTAVSADFQGNREAYYDYKTDWVSEQIDLSPFVRPGDAIRLGFEFNSSQFFPRRYDGIYIDDMKLYSISNVALSSATPSLQDAHFSLFPNPADQTVQLEAKDVFPSTRWVVRDMTGRTVYHTLQPGVIDVHTWKEGVYLVEMLNDSGVVEIQKLVVQGKP